MFFRIWSIKLNLQHVYDVLCIVLNLRKHEVTEVKQFKFKKVNSHLFGTLELSKNIDIGYKRVPIQLYVWNCHTKFNCRRICANFCSDHAKKEYRNVFIVTEHTSFLKTYLVWFCEKRIQSELSKGKLFLKLVLFIM